MPKFTKPFSGCKSEEIYPTEFEIGDECPKELVDAARAAGSLRKSGKKPSAAEQLKIDEAAAAKEAAAELEKLKTAATDANAALEADPDNEDLKAAKEAADKAVTEATDDAA